jgi:hypothetical protein
MRLIVTIVVLATLATPTFAGLFHDGPVGEDGDVFLQQWSNFLNEWDDVALIFGLGDNYQACQDIIENLSESKKYRCVPAR